VQTQAAAAEAGYEQQAMGPPPDEDPSMQIQKLAQLHDSGALSDEEFAAAKAKILGI
jgi:hypothetical protein